MNNNDDSAAMEPHSHRGVILISIYYICFALATSTTFTRLYFRGFVRRNLGWDDACIAISWITALLCAIALTKAVEDGYGDHIQYVKSVKGVLFWSTPTEIIVIIGVALVKTSICIFILRLIGPTQKPVRYIIYANLVILLPFSVAVMFVFCFQCIPLSAVWNELFPPDKCINRQVIDAFVIAISVVNVVTDFITTSLPILIISKLRTDRATKYGICVMIGLGLIISGISIVKAYTGATDFSNPDSTYALVPNAICSVLEHQLGITVASLPPILPVAVAAYEKVSTIFTTTQQNITSIFSAHEEHDGSSVSKSGRRTNLAPYSQITPRRYGADPEAQIQVVTSVETRSEERSQDDAGSEEYGMLTFGDHGQSKTTTTVSGRQLPHTKY